MNSQFVAMPAVGRGRGRCAVLGRQQQPMPSTTFTSSSPPFNPVNTTPPPATLAIPASNVAIKQNTNSSSDPAAVVSNSFTTHTPLDARLQWQKISTMMMTPQSVQKFEPRSPPSPSSPPSQRPLINPARFTPDAHTIAANAITSNSTNRINNASMPPKLSYSPPPGLDLNNNANANKINTKSPVNNNNLNNSINNSNSKNDYDDDECKYCDRPKARVFCKSCGHDWAVKFLFFSSFIFVVVILYLYVCNLIFKGRTRQACPVHKKTIFLNDYACCIHCEATNIVEV